MRWLSTPTPTHVARHRVGWAPRRGQVGCRVQPGPGRWAGGSRSTDGGSPCPQPGRALWDARHQSAVPVLPAVSTRELGTLCNRRQCRASRGLLQRSSTSFAHAVHQGAARAPGSIALQHPARPPRPSRPPLLPRCQPRLHCGGAAVTPGLHRELSAALGAGAGAAAGWAAGRRPRAAPSPSPAAVPERGPWCWCVPAAGIPRPVAGHTVSTASTTGPVAPVPELGLQFGAARPVLRSPGHGAAGPRPPLLCSP